MNNKQTLAIMFPDEIVDTAIMPFSISQCLGFDSGTDSLEAIQDVSPKVQKEHHCIEEITVDELNPNFWKGERNGYKSNTKTKN